MARVCVLLADGFEEIEAITLVDVLRRAEVDTVILGVESERVKGSHGITVEADALLSDHAAEDWDMVLLPGGMPGAAHLRDHAGVQTLLGEQGKRGGRVGAICAAPIALSAAGLLEGKQATSYPAFAEQIVCAEYRDDRVVVDDRVMTSRGPGTALEFGIELVRQLVGESKASELAERMLLRTD